MDSHVVHPGDQDHHVGKHQDEDHHEKKSVLKKVKDKAKKIKDTLKKQGNGHEPDQDYHHANEDDDEEDEDQETTGIKTSDPMRDYTHAQGENPMLMHDDVLDPIRPNKVNSGNEEISGQPNKVNSGKSSVVGEGLHAPQNTPVSSLSHGDNKSKATDPSQTFHSEKGLHVPQNTPVSSLSHGDYNKPKVADPSQTSLSGKERQLGQSKEDLDRPRALEKEPHAPEANPQAYTPPNCETKVTDPTHAGGEEVGVTPIQHSFDKMNIHGGTEQKPHQNLGTGTAQIPVSNLPTGSHDQFPAEKPSNQGSTYTAKITCATSAIANKAISAKNVVASKLGYGVNNDQQGEIAAKTGSAAPDQQGEIAAKTGSAAPDQQGKTIAATVYEKVAGAGSTVKSKIGGGGTQQGTTGEDKGVSVKDYGATQQGTTGKDKGVSVKDYLSEKLRPGEEDRALSEVISETLHKGKADDTGTTQPVGKVTESEEVTRRLGPDDGENDDKDQSRYTKVVADSLRGVVGSFFGKSDKTNQTTSQQSPGSSPGTHGFSSSGSGVAGHQDQGQGDGVEQQRLQGSDN